MRFLFRMTLILVLLMLPAIAYAQVKVAVAMDQPQFLRDEELPVEVRIQNLSGRPLAVGIDAGWVSFHVESLDGFLLNRLNRMVPPRRMLVESSTTVTQRVEILPLYDLSKPGRYQVTAIVRIPAFGKTFSSKPFKFDIANGVPIWKENIGVPSKVGKPEIRRYTLLRANYISQPALYLRVSDVADTKAFDVRYLGTLVSFSRPEYKIDGASRLHVIFQNGARSFRYNVVNPDGKLEKRQTHSYFESRPRLSKKGSDVTVIGGVRRADKTDIPFEPRPLKPRPVVEEVDEEEKEKTAVSKKDSGANSIP